MVKDGKHIGNNMKKQTNTTTEIRLYNNEASDLIKAGLVALGMGPIDPRAVITWRDPWVGLSDGYDLKMIVNITIPDSQQKEEESEGNV